jgi:hypothetical protein
MKKKNFFQRLASHYLTSHLIAMAVTMIILCIGVKVGLDVYTHHGENIVVPDLKGMSYEKAFALLDKDGLNIVISDSGYAFDPTVKADADTTLSAEERPIGGLGILLVRRLMDSINYERVDGKNVLTMWKASN